MKKFTTLLICCLMIIAFGLSGCAGFSIDRVKYYNEVVAKVGDTNITRFELLSAYNSYGSSSFSDNAMNSTLDLLIDRELLYQSALGDSRYSLTEYQVNTLIKDLFDSIDEQMDEYVTSAKTILKIDVAEEDSSEEEDSYLYKDYIYSRRAEVVSERIYYTDGTMTTVSNTPTSFYTTTSKIVYKTEDETIDSYVIDQTILNNYVSDSLDGKVENSTLRNTVEEIVNKYLENFKYSLTEEEKANEIYNKSIELFAKDLIDYEYYLRDSNNKPYNTVTNDLIYRYFERNFTSQIKSQYLTNIRTYYLENETLSIDKLTSAYSSLVQADKDKYTNHYKTYANDMKKIGTKADTIFYHPESTDGTEFGYFVHVLLNFTDNEDEEDTNTENNGEEKPLSQTEEIAQLDQLLKYGTIDEEEYDARFNEIANRTFVYLRDTETGLLTDTEVPLSEVISEYYEIYNTSDKTTQLYDFIQFMFKYTGDTATLSSGMPYVVGNNGYSSMVENFTNEALNLMDGIKDGTLSNRMSNPRETGYCITEYGIHFIYYIGDVSEVNAINDENNVYIQQFDNLNGTNLYTTILNPLTKETYFDMLFDLVYPATNDEVYTSNTGYTDYEDVLVEDAKAKIKVIKYTTKINSTTATIN